MKASKIRPAALAVVIMAFALSGCASHAKASGPARAVSSGATYGSGRALIRVLAADGAPCKRVHVLSAPSQPGMTTLADCSGKSDGDTSVSTFASHADAITFASRMIAMQPGTSAEVVGPNWVVNTVPAYASWVRSAIGGQVFTSRNRPAVQATAAPVQTAPATPTQASPARVRFIVTGTAPDGADITYGSDADSRTPPGDLGILGTGTAIPWHGSVPFDGSATFYSLSAQLQGSGDIHCKIVVTRPGYVPLTVSHGHASGGYNICRAQAAPSGPSGLNWRNEN
jgi:hypothetical protein